MSTRATSFANMETVRDAFPALQQEVNNKPLIYFDNAATTQKPEKVLQALQQYYQHDNANIHRAAHTLANRATAAYENTRQALRAFVNAQHSEEIIFTSGVTESINLLAHTCGVAMVQPGDDIIITSLEHHSNIVPWQMMAQQRQANLKVIPITDNCDLDLEAYHQMLGPKTKIVAVNHASNSLGTINPIKDIIAMAHEAGAITVVDGAQAAAHLPVDVQALDCDFYAISGHKMYGPTGIGMLYGKKALLEQLPPYMGGGEMIRDVTFAHTTYNDIPYKFEAGTPNIADAIAWKDAIAFIQALGKDHISSYENMLVNHAIDRLESIDKVRIIGSPQERVSLVSFLVEGVHPFDVGQWLDTYGIAVRTGHHCTQPLMDLLEIEGTIRASFAIYNTTAEIDIFIERLQTIITKMT